MTHYGSHRVVELQSLRGIMALVVLISHCSLVYSLTPAQRVGIDAVFNPHAAVIFFFVLSGYVLMVALERMRNQPNAISVFYLRRMFRLMPLVVVATLIALILMRLFYVDVAGASPWFRSLVNPELFTSRNVALSFLALSTVVVPPVWTILVEAAGSFLVPVHERAAAAFRGGARVMLVALLVMTIVVSRIQWEYSYVLVHLIYFAAGASLYSSRERWFGFLHNHPILTWGLVGASALLLFGFRALWYLYNLGVLAPIVIDYFNVWQSLAEGVFACLLIAGVVAIKGGIRPLRIRRVALIGDLSFGIYLLHFPVMSMIVWTLHRVFEGGSGSALLDGTILLVSTLLVVLPLSWVLYRCVERPGIELGRVLTAGLTRERSAVLSSQSSG